MGIILSELEDFMRQYFGTTGKLLLDKELFKNRIQDVDMAGDYEKRLLLNSLSEDLMEPIMSKGRVSLARSRLMGILKLKPILAGLPTQEDMGPRVVDYFKSVEELVIREESLRYNVKDIGDSDMEVRIGILRGILRNHLGEFSDILLDEKMMELGLTRLDDARDYVKIMLMESIITSLVNVCVKPVTARMIRSELISILKLDDYLAKSTQDNSEMPLKLRKELECEEPKAIRLSPEKRRDFEDLALLVVREEYGRIGVHNPAGSEVNIKSEVFKRVIGRVFGGMAAHIVDSMGPKDPSNRVFFMSELFRAYLSRYMLEKDVLLSLDKLMKSMSLG